jgi:hypothetical protein
MEGIMKGDKVIVRTFDGEPRVLIVWDSVKDMILVCNEENYQALTSGENGLWPVGIPKTDVFTYDSKVIKQGILENWRNSQSIWNYLRQYS